MKTNFKRSAAAHTHTHTHTLRIRLFSVLVLIIAFTFVGCEEEKNIDIPNYEIYQEIGTEHNNGLDYVFDELKKNQAVKTYVKK
ncbi:MAG: hypothetical protein ACK5L5_07535 [Bacteroidales bacterium]